MESFKMPQNISPNFIFYKTVTENADFSFDVYKMEDKNEKCLHGYIAIPNKSTKDIDIYKIYSKDNFKLIHSIKIGYENIFSMKYFYDSYHDIHYLTALINNKTNILIWKIENETKYNLITNHIEIVSQGGICMSRRPILFHHYLLIFNKEQSLLIIFYIIQRGCTWRDKIIEKYNFINNKSVEKYSLTNIPFNSFPLYLKEKLYLGLLFGKELILCNIFSPTLNESFENTKIKFGLKDYNRNIRNVIIIGNGFEDEYIYVNELYCSDYTGYQDENNYKNIIYKTNLKKSENLFQIEINNGRQLSMINWNKNYLLLFEDESKYFYLFNTKKCRIENKFSDNNNNLVTAKRLVINNEELLLVSDVNGIINIWVNS